MGRPSKIPDLIKALKKEPRTRKELTAIGLDPKAWWIFKTRQDNKLPTILKLRIGFSSARKNRKPHPTAKRNGQVIYYLDGDQHNVTIKLAKLYPELKDGHMLGAISYQDKKLHTLFIKDSSGRYNQHKTWLDLMKKREEIKWQ